MVTHSSYDSETQLNDIAVIILGKKLDFKGEYKHLEPICLPPFSHSKEKILIKETYHNECYATGFGLTSENGPLALQLQQVDLKYVPNKQCKKIWRNLFYSRYMLCAGPLTGGRDTCLGDSGGPWQCLTRKGAWTIEGITSFGAKCAQIGKTGIYTRVASYLDWIKSKK